MTIVRLILYTISLFGLSVIGLEVIARQESVEKRLILPSYGTPDYAPFDVQINNLNKHIERFGIPNCFFFGVSFVWNGIYEAEFEQGYREQTEQPIHCYNLGLSAIRIDTFTRLAHYIVQQYHPHWIIYGTSARDFFERHPLDNRFEELPWLNYMQGAFNGEGWLVEHSILKRYFQAYVQWSSPNFMVQKAERQRINQAISPTGEFPYPYLNQYVQVHSEPLKNPYYQDFSISQERLNPLDELLALNNPPQTQVFVFEMPVHQHYYSQFGEGLADREEFLAAVSGKVLAHSLPFWQISPYNLIPDAGWTDYGHLLPSGGRVFSYWLGTQVGAAVRTGEWETPPLADMSLPTPDELNQTYYGLSAEGQARWEQFQPPAHLPQSEIIFAPSTMFKNLTWVRYNLGNYLELAPEADWQQGFELLHLLELIQTDATQSEQQTAIADWRKTKDAQVLLDAGIEYLLYDDLWLSWLTEEEISRLQDSQHYELIGSWTHPTLLLPLHLYHLHP